MRRVRDKLRDSRGVTILMALFALLVASMVCIVILGASVTAAKQAKLDQEHEQDMLLLQSAGELIASNIANEATTVTYSTTTTYTKSTGTGTKGTGGSGAPSYSSSTSTDGPTVSAGCLIRNELQVAAEQVIVDSPSSDATPRPFTVTLSSSSALAEGEGAAGSSARLAALNGAAVNGSFVLRCGQHDATTEGTGLNYQLVFTFELLREGTVVQSVYMKMSGHKETGTSSKGSEGDNEYSVTTTDTYSWGAPEFYVANVQGV